MKWTKIERHITEEGEVFDSAMADEGEKILVTFEDRKGERWIDTDVLMFDIKDGYYLESYGGIDEGVIAWMPMPEPYQDEEEKRR